LAFAFAVIWCGTNCAGKKGEKLGKKLLCAQPFFTPFTASEQEPFQQFPRFLFVCWNFGMNELDLIFPAVAEKSRKLTQISRTTSSKIVYYY
jgi:hypothetical protein